MSSPSNIANLVRHEIAATSHTIVAKVGTNVLTGPDARLDRDRIEDLSAQVHQLKATGHQVLLVSSGAVGAGMGRMGIIERPTDVARLQALAAIGQSCLVEAYDHALRQYGHHAAQVLLVAGDLEERTRYLNARNTLRTLLDYGAVPVINENDTVSVEELRTTFGDNDRLAAIVTNLLQAPLLVLLSDVEGLYDGPPDEADSRVIPLVKTIDASILALVHDRHTGRSKGGMASKLEAARIATTAGENVIVADGRRPNVLVDILAGQDIGTLFLAQGQTIAARKRWIGLTVRPRGRVVLDAGACRAVQSKGCSLLPIGVIEVQGQFDKGDVIAMVDQQGCEIARGLTNYAYDEVRKTMGLRTDAITDVLGYRSHVEVVHRDNMVVTARA